MSYGPFISRITLPNGNTYDIKDKEARDLIDQIAAGGLSFKISSDAATTPLGVDWTKDDVVITGTLQAGASTKPYIYLVPHIQTAGDADYYIEYVTVNEGTEASPAYIWERLGSTDPQFDDLGDLAYKDDASGTFKIETVDSAALSNGAVTTSATYTPAGSVNVTLSQTPTNAILTKADYTPEGTISKPNVTVAPTTAKVEVKDAAGSVTAGSAASFTSGSFNGGSFTQGEDQFTAPTWTATVPTTEVDGKTVSTETLEFSFTAGSFKRGIDSFTPATHGADTFNPNTPTSVTLPTFKEQSVMTGASAELEAAPTFTGTKATEALVTNVAYDKAAVGSQKFTGTAATINSTGTANGTVDLTKTEKTKNVTVS